MLVHPTRLIGVSIAAPGSVTLIDDARDYWVGTRDLATRSAEPLDLPNLRTAPVHLLVGANDVDTWEIAYFPESRSFMEGINDTGSTRVERLASLQANLRAHNVPVLAEVVPGVPHDGVLLVSRASDFFASTLLRYRGG